MRKSWMLGYSNVVNTKAAQFVKQQPHGGSNQSLSVKGTKIDKEKGACDTKLFYPVQFINFNI